jgi:hypothetical protein
MYSTEKDCVEVKLRISLKKGTRTPEEGQVGPATPRAGSVHDARRDWVSVERTPPICAVVLGSVTMDTTTLVIIVLLVLLLGGGGFFYRGRGRRL